MGSLKGEKYISLATFRKTGKAVETPVWFVEDAQDDGVLYAFTAGDSGKVKRLRNSGRSRVAACNVRGTVRGEWIDAETTIIDDPGSVGRALRLMRKKYRFSMLIADLGARLTGRFHRRRYLKVRLQDVE